MKHLVLSGFTLLLNCFGLFAQTTAEEVDSLTANINRLQYEATGLTGKEEKESSTYSFSKQNFTYNNSTGLAQVAVYKKQGTEEVLYITGDIDLSKAIGAYFAKYSNELAAIHLEFTESSIRTISYVDGYEVERVLKNDVPFYFKTSMDSDLSAACRWQMMYALVGICNKGKIDNGLLTYEKSDKAQLAFMNLLNHYRTCDLQLFTDYLNFYPTSLYASQVKMFKVFLQKQLADERKVKALEQKNIAAPADTKKMTKL